MTKQNLKISVRKNNYNFFKLMVELIKNRNNDEFIQDFFEQNKLNRISESERKSYRYVESTTQDEDIYKYLQSGVDFTLFYLNEWSVRDPLYDIIEDLSNEDNTEYIDFLDDSDMDKFEEFRTIELTELYNKLFELKTKFVNSLTVLKYPPINNKIESDKWWIKNYTLY